MNIKNKIMSLDEQIYTLHTENATYADWDKILHFLEVRYRYVLFLVFMAQANKACTRLLLLARKIMSLVSVRKSG